MPFVVCWLTARSGDLANRGDPVRLQSPYLPPEELAQVFGGGVAC